MQIIKPRVHLRLETDAITILKNIEYCGRLCYKSEHKITKDSYKTFIENIIKRNHLSVIEHGKCTAIVVCDRGVSHEIVRHRIGSYSQESTRYVNYQDGIEFVEPIFWRNDIAKMEIWKQAMLECEERYKALIGLLCKPEEARAILPNSLKTEIAITYNFREWRHFLSIRGASSAHIQIREVAILLLQEFHKYMPVMFDDFIIDEKNMTIKRQI